MINNPEFWLFPVARSWQQAITRYIVPASPSLYPANPRLPKLGPSLNARNHFARTSVIGISNLFDDSQSRLGAKL